MSQLLFLGNNSVMVPVPFYAPVTIVRGGIMFYPCLSVRQFVRPILKSLYNQLLPEFLWSPPAGERDIVVTILVRRMCVRPSGFVRTITCTIKHGF